VPNVTTDTAAISVRTEAAALAGFSSLASGAMPRHRAGKNPAGIRKLYVQQRVLQECAVGQAGVRRFYAQQRILQERAVGQADPAGIRRFYAQQRILQERATSLQILQAHFMHRPQDEDYEMAAKVFACAADACPLSVPPRGQHWLP